MAGRGKRAAPEAASAAPSPVAGDDEIARDVEASKRKRAAAQAYLEALRGQTSGALSVGGVSEPNSVGAEAKLGKPELASTSAHLDSKDAAVDARLRLDVLQAAGRVFRSVARDYASSRTDRVAVLCAQRHFTPTAVCHLPDGALAVGYKGGAVAVFPGAGGKATTLRDAARRYDILSLAAHGSTVAAGCSDGAVRVWDSGSGDCTAPSASFTHHRGAVTGVAFRAASGLATLYSCGADRTVRVWNLQTGTEDAEDGAESSGDESPADESENSRKSDGAGRVCVASAGLADTLYGHQDGVLAIAAVPSPDAERCVTVGGRDRSARVWKIAEETQLVFRPGDGPGALTAVAALDRDHFVTGGDDGGVSLWSVARRRPLCVSVRAGAAVTALSALPMADVFAASYDDGAVVLWGVDTESWRELRELRLLSFPGETVPVPNALSFSPDGRALAVAAGRDNRDGRWTVRRGAKNAAYVFSLLP